MYAKYSARDIETQTLSVDISDDQIHKSGNLPGKLKVCIGARIMLTANINTSDCFVNVSTGKIECMQMSRAGNNLVAIIYVEFDYVDAVNFVINNLLRDEVKDCVPITAITKTFPYSHSNETVTVLQKPSPSKLGHVITEFSRFYF